MTAHRFALIVAGLLLFATVGCGGAKNGWRLPFPRTDENEVIIKRVEDYRLAVERRDAGKLLLMASKEYWEVSDHCGYFSILRMQ